ncbi:hypothetical protein P692DRAFT_201726484 [Suillus brevipes Sb2]|nr:hypothetical protein P692DRAFT_201726484 [Suillus brevipes Sb2]
MVQQSQVRKLTLQLMKRKDKYAPFGPLPNTRDIERFEKTGAGGPTLDDFRVNILGKPADKWNKTVAQLFAAYFVESGWFSCTDVDAVAQAFKRHIPALQRQYKRSCQTEDERPEDELDIAEAEAADARRRSLRTRRAESCDVHPGVRKFKGLWESLTYEVMSGDEAEHRRGKMRYLVTKMPWRSPEVTNFLRVFDMLHLSTHFKTNGGARWGAFPHRRYPSSRIDTKTSPVPGLPKNFYDEVWFASLNAVEQKALRSLPSVDITLPAAVLA